MKRLIYSGMLCLLGLLCLPQVAQAQLTADFSVSLNGTCPPVVATFTDMSTGSPTSWIWQQTTVWGSWTFSQQQNPTFQFWQSGTFDITLIVSDGTTSDTITQAVVVPGPSFDFSLYSSTISGTCAPMDFTLNYAGTFNGTWFWDMGDGTVYNNTNSFTHTYTAPGFYNPNVTVTDPSGCVQNFWVDSVWVDNGLCISADVTQIDCGANTNGEIDLTVNGGVPPYSFSWSNGATTEDLTGLSEGIFTVTVTDANGQSEVGTYEIDASLIDLDFAVGKADCNGNGGALWVTINGGQSPYSILWSNGATTSNISNLTAGGYSITVTDANGCSDHEVVFVPYEDSCRINLSGRVYLDQNQNCVFDAGDSPLPLPVKLSGGAYSVWTYPDSNGIYDYDYFPGPITLDVDNLYYYWYGTNLANNLFFSCPSSGQHTLPFQTTDSTGLDFGIYVDSSWQDLAVYLHVGPARPGFVNQQWLYARNWGVIPVAPTVTWTHDPEMTFLSASITPTSYDPLTRTATWNLATLNFLQWESIHIFTQVDTFASLGSLTCHTASIDPLITDSYPDNNVDTTCRVLTASYDPNDKQVSPQGMGRDGFVDEATDWFTYTIRFQNTGNDTAFFVVIRDTLDEGFIPGSFTPLASSHDYELMMGESGEITFNHEWIYLPDSTTDPLGSQGFVSYRIRRRDNLEAGDRLTNRASIYFDFNAPIVTNTTISTLARAAVSVPDPALGLRIYPNPARSHVWVESTESPLKQVAIVTVQGKVCAQWKGSLGQRQQLSLDGLSPGMYLIKVETEQGMSTHKMTVR